MLPLSPDGRARIAEIADRSGFAIGAVETMLDAIVAGGGAMAQFDHPAFGGSGQWMRGGMLMMGSPFDQELKARVDRLCNTLADWVAGAADAGRNEGFQRQSQTSGGHVVLQSGLHGDAHKTQFGDCAGAKSVRGSLHAQIPRGGARMMDVGRVAERDQRVTYPLI